MSAIPAPPTPTLATLWTQRASQVLAGAAASVTFSGLSDAVYRLSGTMIPTAASIVTEVRFNNDSASTYTSAHAAATNTTPTPSVAGTTHAFVAPNAYVPAAADYPLTFTAVIQKPLAASHSRSTVQGGAMLNTGVNQSLFTTGWKWPNTTDLITRIDVIASTSTFKIGSHFTVEGMA